jgi:hypothetical protein
MEEKRNAYNIFDGKREGKRPPSLGCVDWIHVAQDRIQWLARNFDLPYTKQKANYYALRFN